MLRCEKKMTNLFSCPSSPSLVLFLYIYIYIYIKKKKKKHDEEEEIFFRTIKENNLIISIFSLDFLFNQFVDVFFIVVWASNLFLAATILLTFSLSHCLDLILCFFIAKSWLIPPRV